MHALFPACAGPGLAFIAYPKALSRLPGSNFWFVLFFLMILFLGLDTQVGPGGSAPFCPDSTARRSRCLVSLQFVCVESLATSLSDLFPRQLRRRGGRELLVLAIAISCFLLGLPLLSEVGVGWGGLLRADDQSPPVSQLNASGVSVCLTACLSLSTGGDRPLPADGHLRCQRDHPPLHRLR